MCNNIFVNNYLKRSKHMSRTIGEIISVFEDAHKKSDTFVTLSHSETLRIFNDTEMKMIEENRDIFFMASKSRIVLVHWICGFVRKLFEKYDYSDIDIISESYDAIRDKFGTKAFNRTELAKLFGIVGNKKLAYDSFVDYEQKYTDAYNRAVEEDKKLTSMPHISIKVKEKQNDMAKSLENILCEKKNKEILLQRALGKTLDSVGKQFKVTRERIRQMESKPRIQIERWLSYNTDTLLKTVCRDGAFDDKRAAKIFGDDSLQILKYIISTKIFDHKWSYVKETDLIIYDEVGNFYDDLDVTLSQAKESKMNFDETLEGLIDDGYAFLTEDRFKAILNARNFNVYRNTIYHGKMTIGKAIALSAIDYPGNRVRITDKEELQKFADYINANYDMNVKIGRALSTRIQDILVMVGKATYGPKSLIRLPEDVFKEITDYISTMKNDRISYSALFERFKDTLLSRTSIDNHYFLHGILKEYEKENGYICLRYYVCRDDAEGMKSKDYFKKLADLLAANKPMTTKEIVEAMTDWNEMYIKYAMMYYPEIVQWDKNTFTNVDGFSLTDTEKQVLSDIVDECIDNKYHYTSSYVIYDKAVEKAPELLRKYGIENEKQFFSVVQFFCKDKGLLIKRPHIVKSRRTDGSFTTDDFIRLIANRTKIVDKRTLLCDMIKYYGNKNSSLSLSLQKVLTDYMRIGRFDYIQKKKLKLTEEDKKKIVEQIEKYMIGGRILLLNRIPTYKDFPDVGFEWSKWMLSEIVQEYDLGFKKTAQAANASVHSLLPIVRSDDDELETREDIVRWLILNDYEGSMEYSELMRYIRQLDIYHTVYSAEEIYSKFKDIQK